MYWHLCVPVGNGSIWHGLHLVHPSGRTWSGRAPAMIGPPGPARTITKVGTEPKAPNRPERSSARRAMTFLTEPEPSITQAILLFSPKRKMERLSLSWMQIYISSIHRRNCQDISSAYCVECPFIGRDPHFLLGGNNTLEISAQNYWIFSFKTAAFNMDYQEIFYMLSWGSSERQKYDLCACGIFFLYFWLIIYIKRFKLLL